MLACAIRVPFPFCRESATCALGTVERVCIVPAVCWLQRLGIQNVTQRVDLSTMRVTNTISLAAGFGVSATAPLKITGPKRMVYNFDGLAVRLAGLDLPSISLGGSPEGKGGKRGGPGGWTDTVYIDEDLRIVRNFQKDLLVFRKAAEQPSPPTTR